MVLSRIAKRKNVDPPPKAPRFWLPAAVLVLSPIALGLLSLSDPWFTNHASILLPHAVLYSAWACGAFGVCLLLSRQLSAAALAHAEGPALAGPRVHRAWLAVAWAGAAGAAVLLKFWQYRSGQLPEDSAAIANVAFNFWDHLGFETSIFGLPSYFAIHFMPIIALFAPIGRLGGLFGMLAAQAAVLCAAPFAVYALTRRRTGSAAAGLAAGFLALTAPLFFLAARASLAPQVCLPAFLLWAVYCAETRRWPAALILTILGAACTEQAPLVFAGAGLWAALRLPGRRLWGLGAMAGAVLLWRFEWRVIHSYPHPYDFWGSFFARLGPSPRAALASAAAHPLRFAALVLWPPQNLLPLWRPLWSTGLLPLVSPLELIPFLVAIAPHVAADPTTFYHNLDLHYAAYVMAPLYWALALGTADVWLWLKRRNREGLLLALAMLVGGLNFWRSPGLLIQNRGPQLFWGLPPLLSSVPEQASIWVLEYAAPPLAFRKNIQLIYGDGAVGKPGAVLFKPDYVLIDVTFLLEPYKQAYRDRIATYLEHEHYGAVAATPTMYLLQRQRTSKPGEPLETLGTLPEADKQGLAYGAEMKQVLLSGLQRQLPPGETVQLSRMSQTAR